MYVFCLTQVKIYIWTKNKLYCDICKGFKEKRETCKWPMYKIKYFALLCIFDLIFLKDGWTLFRLEISLDLKESNIMYVGFRFTAAVAFPLGESNVISFLCLCIYFRLTNSIPLYLSVRISEWIILAICYLSP